jgi:hypothetical protein
VQAVWPAGAKVPSGQRLQVPAPAAANVPAGQSLQAAPPADPEKVPGRQLEQALAPAGEWVPGSQAVHASAPELAVKVPAAQTEQLWPPGLAAKVPGVQVLQTVSALAVHAISWCEPAGQVVHGRHCPPEVRWPLAGQLVQVVGVPLQLAQLASQIEQTRSETEVQAALWYWLARQSVEQVMHTPWCAKLPLGHWPQTVSALLVQAVCWARPGAHTLHGMQCPSLVRYCDAEQLVQWVALPLQVLQPGSQPAQIRSASATHAALWYLPSGQVPAQAPHAPLLRNAPGSHDEQVWSAALLQLIDEAHPGTGPQISQVSAVPLSR